MREVAAQLERPVLLFSGGKDSIVLVRLAEKAFRPGRFPFPLMHVDTGHNFPEVIEFRDRLVEQIGERLIVASVQESIDTGRVVEQTGPRASRNQLQTTTLLDAIARHGFDAAFGGRAAMRSAPARRSGSSRFVTTPAAGTRNHSPPSARYRASARKVPLGPRAAPPATSLAPGSIARLAAPAWHPDPKPVSTLPLAPKEWSGVPSAA